MGATATPPDSGKAIGYFEFRIDIATSSCQTWPPRYQYSYKARLSGRIFVLSSAQVVIEDFETFASTITKKLATVHFPKNTMAMEYSESLPSPHHSSDPKYARTDFTRLAVRLSP
jgi:hypothetical protein